MTGADADAMADAAAVADAGHGGCPAEPVGAVLAALRERRLADRADELLLDEAAAELLAAGPGRIVVIDDRLGALTLGTLDLLESAGRLPAAESAESAQSPAGSGPKVRVHQDLVPAERALAAAAAAAGRAGAYARHDADAALVAGARVVLGRLPQSPAAVRALANLVADHADPQVTLFAAGPVKYLTRSMNDVLAERFDRVTATLGRGKARGLVARGLVARGATPRAGGDPAAGERRILAEPQLFPGATRPIVVVARAGVFGGAALDQGTRFLLANIEGLAPAPRDIVDLGCGTGLLAVRAALSRRHAQVVAVDASAAAVDSARRTAAANGVAARVRTVRDDAGDTLPDACADVVLLNPPFHENGGLSTGTAHRMFATAGRILRPGGELWAVWNSHLRYRPALQRAVGPTVQVARNPRFTVTRSVAGGRR